MRISHSKMKELRDQRARVFSIASGMLAGNGLTAETRSKFEAAMGEVDSLTKQIQEAELGPFVSYRTEDRQKEIRHAEAFGRFVRFGEKVLTAEMRSVLERRDVSEGGSQVAHVGSYSSLGYFVPTGFVDRVEQATKYFAPLLEDGIFDIIRTSTGNALPFPVSDDTANAAVIIGEGQPASEQDVTASHVVLGAFKATAGVVKASNELLQDSGIDVESWLADRFGERYGRGYEQLLTNGVGTTEPMGLLTALAANGVTPVIASGSSANSGGSETGVNSIGYADLVNLEHSVDPSYRRNAKFMLNDATLGTIKKILDKFGRPLWTPGVSSGDPDTILGYQYVINQHMPTISASAQTVVFGDLKKFKVRRVLDMSVQRLAELYAVSGQVGFVSFNRVDSNLVVANGTHPIGVLQQHS